MKKSAYYCFASFIAIAAALPVSAQNAYFSSGATGSYGNGSYYTGQGPQGMGGQSTYSTGQNSVVALPTSLAGLAPVFGYSGGLPPTRLDSFVVEAGASAEAIYGDEDSGQGYPPYFGYTTDHRINTGIVGMRDAGLTTGHSSMMPNAVGADEFLQPPGEWSMSGSNDGNPQESLGLDSTSEDQAEQQGFQQMLTEMENNGDDSDGGSSSSSNPLTSLLGSVPVPDPLGLLPGGSGALPNPLSLLTGSSSGGSVSLSLF